MFTEMKTEEIAVRSWYHKATGVSWQRHLLLRADWLLPTTWTTAPLPLPNLHFMFIFNSRRSLLAQLCGIPTITL
jgi:hypothetical protein